MDGALVHICEPRISLSSMRFLHTVCKRAKFTQCTGSCIQTTIIYYGHSTVMSTTIKPELERTAFFLKTEKQREELQSILLYDVLVVTDALLNAAKSVHVNWHTR